MIDDDDDLDSIPVDIMRLAQDVSQTWRRCHRKACKRGRGCRGRDLPCVGERLPRTPTRNPEKAARDDARAMAIFQRMLRQRLEQVQSEQEHAPTPQERKTRRRKAD